MLLGEFGSGQVLWSMVWFFLFFIWIWLLITVFGDIFRSNDLSGWGKALWTIFVIVLPYLGVFVYLIARGHKMQQHDIEAAQGAGGAVPSVRPEACRRERVPADEIARLADLREKGVISDASSRRRRPRLSPDLHDEIAVSGMSEYPTIADHGLIGDLQTAALVATDGTIDWFCCPRFDSPSVFASLLDAERGGHFRIAPGRRRLRHASSCTCPDTAILITRFMTADGVGEVIDFMPVAGEPADRPAPAGPPGAGACAARCSFVVECQPRFDYGREPHTVEITSDGAVVPQARRPDAHAASRRRSDRAAATSGPARIEQTSDGLRVDGHPARRRDRRRGARVRRRGGPGRSRRDELIETLFEQTRDFWRRWIGRSTYRGRWREMVDRSAMTLKLMTYAPTGALVAAPTAGLPEQVGGERNWDYRYTWVRDASFSVYALLGLGFTEEAEAFVAWLDGPRRARACGKRSGPLQIMYRVDGSSDLVEETLDHFEGYRGSRPVRIGNGAADQLQLDIYGEAMDSIYLGRHARAAAPARRLDQDPRRCSTGSATTGTSPTRASGRPAAAGRTSPTGGSCPGSRSTAPSAWPADTAGPRRPRRGGPSSATAIYDQIMDRGWNHEREAFVQHYGTDVLDASLLLHAARRLRRARTTRCGSRRCDAMDEELVSDSLVYRYDPSASPDGLRGSEGTFSICTFWYVDALARPVGSTTPG